MENLDGEMVEGVHGQRVDVALRGVPHIEEILDMVNITM